MADDRVHDRVRSEWTSSPPPLVPGLELPRPGDMVLPDGYEASAVDFPIGLSSFRAFVICMD
jgi:hypothetical protein